MSPVFAKLNLGNQPEILVLDAPASFEPELAALAAVRVRRDLAEVAAVSFALVFVTRQAALDAASVAVAAKAQGDALLWFAYPKRRPNATPANSTATPAGTRFAPTASTPCARSPSTRTGRRCASGARSTSAGADPRGDSRAPGGDHTRCRTQQ